MPWGAEIKTSLGGAISSEVKFRRVVLARGF
jgi:hypothetical protein